MFEAERMMIEKGYFIKCRVRDKSLYFCNREKDQEIECDSAGMCASTMSNYEYEPADVELDELECIVSIIREIRFNDDFATAIRNAMKGWQLFCMNGQFLVIYFDNNPGYEYIQIEKGGKCKSLRTLNALEKENIQRIASFVFDFNDVIHYETVEMSYFQAINANF